MMSEEELRRYVKRMEIENRVKGSMVSLLLGYVSEEDKEEIIEDLMNEVLEFRDEIRNRMINEIKKGK